MRAGFTVVATQNQQFPDFRKRKPKPLSASNKLDSLHIVPTKQTKSPFGTEWLIEEPLLLVEPDGVNTQSRFFGNPADLHRVPHLPPGYTLESTPESSFILRCPAEQTAPGESLIAA